MRKPRIVDKMVGKITDSIYEPCEIKEDEPEITVRELSLPEENILKMTPQEFAIKCREYLKEKTERSEYRQGVANEYFLNNYKTVWFNGTDLQFLSKELDISGAFLNINENHWNLVLSANERIFEAYDPLKTYLRNEKRRFDTNNILGKNIILSEDLWKKHSAEIVRRNDYTYSKKDFLVEQKYKVSDDFIDELGAVQVDTYNCGPYCLYAAKVSNEGIVVLDDENELEFFE